MEKYARQAVSEGIKAPDDLRVLADSEIYRVLNLHYNRNNHIEVSGLQPTPHLCALGCLSVGRSPCLPHPARSSITI